MFNQKGYKIYSIRLLYYDDFKDENDYYDKIYKTISIWFCTNLLISNRITQFDESLKYNLFPKIDYNKVLYNSILTDNQQFLFYNNYELSNGINNEQIMLHYIYKNAFYLCYLSKELKRNIEFGKEIIDMITYYFNSDDNLINFIETIIYNYDFKSYQNIIYSNKYIMVRLMKRDKKYIQFLSDEIKLDINVIKFIIDNIINDDDKYNNLLNFITIEQLLIAINDDIIYLYFINFYTKDKDKTFIYPIILNKLLIDPKYTNFQSKLNLGSETGINYFNKEINFLLTNFNKILSNKNVILEILNILKEKIVPIIIKYETGKHYAFKLLEKYDEFECILTN